RYLLQKAKRLKGLFRTFLRLGVLRGGIGETFPRSVHRRPKPVVVAIVRIGAGFVRPYAQRCLGDVAKWGPLDVTLDLLFVNLGFRRHVLARASDGAQPAPRHEPAPALLVHCPLCDFIVWQPAGSLPVMPLLSIESNCAQPRAEPHLILGPRRDPGE